MLRRPELLSCGWLPLPGGPKPGVGFQAHFVLSWGILQTGKAYKTMTVSEHWAGCKRPSLSGRALHVVVSKQSPPAALHLWDSQALSACCYDGDKAIGMVTKIYF